MRRVLATLLLWSCHSLADPPVLRFSIAESWSMPLVRLEQEQPVEGIVFDLIQAIARETGIVPRYHVLARLRLEQAMASGDIDVRCYVATEWLTNRPGDYVWSIPLFKQQDLLVGRPGDTLATRVQALAGQTIGTVLGYTYPSLEPLFANGQLHREDSRSQLLVLRKLQAGRIRHAVSNQLTLHWFNRQLPERQRLPAQALLQEQSLGCMVRSDPALPTQGVLRALVRLKQSGEVEQIVQRYTATPESPTTAPDNRISRAR